MSNIIELKVRLTYSDDVSSGAAIYQLAEEVLDAIVAGCEAKNIVLVPDNVSTLDSIEILDLIDGEILATFDTGADEHDDEG